MENYLEKREKYVQIRINDLFWKICFRWRFVVLLMLFFAVLLGGAKYVQDYKQLQNQKIDERYAQKSILMKLNPYKVETTVLQYQIDVSEYEQDNNFSYAKNLLYAYKDFIGQNGIGKKITENYNLKIEPEYIGEIIFFDSPLTEGGASSENVLNTFFSLKILESKEEELLNISDMVEKEVESYYRILNERIGQHKLIRVAQYHAVNINNELLEQQNKISENNNLQQMPQSLSFDLKYIIIGFVMGGILAIFILSFAYISNGRIKNYNEIEECYGIRTLGEYTIFPKIQGRFSIIDKCLYMVKFKNCTALEDQIEYAALNAALLCKKYNIRNLFITTTMRFSNEEQNAFTLLEHSILKHNIKVVSGQFLSYNVETLNGLSEAEGVLFVEELDLTKRDELDKQVNICLQHDVKIVGCVVFKKS